MHGHNFHVFPCDISIHEKEPLEKKVINSLGKADELCKCFRSNFLIYKIYQKIGHSYDYK